MHKTSTKAKAVRILQVTDAHLYNTTDQTLVGMNCDESLQDVLELIRSGESAAEFLLFTGDASQDSSTASYQRLELLLGSLGLPQAWIPGNHDELQQMQNAIGRDNPCFCNSLVLGNWRIILLNSSVPGQVHGRLAPSELDFLRRTLQECQEAHILVCLHHNPVPVAAQWLQQHALKNPDDLFALLDTDQRVRAVVFGHIHHELSQERNGVLYLGAPSTCVQFHPTSKDFALDTCNPGYRWLELSTDGGFETGINRVVGKVYEVDFSGIGY